VHTAITCLYAIDIGRRLLEVLDAAALVVFLLGDPVAVVPMAPGLKLVRSALRAASPQAVIDVHLLDRVIFLRLSNVLSPIVSPCRMSASVVINNQTSRSGAVTNM
jgi:hypothetical protein